MSGGPLLSPADYAALSLSSGVHKEILASRLSHSSTRALNEFKVPELKEIVKWLKGRPAWSTNTYLHQHRPQPSTSGSTGKKQQLVEYLRTVLQAQQGQLPMANNNAPAAAADPNAANNAAMALQQQQYRVQQQQAQAAAARFQAPNDPYRSYAAPNVANGGRPMQPVPQQYASNPYGYQMQPQQQQQQVQQFAYTNGTPRYDAYGMQAQQPRAYTQMPPHQQQQQQQPPNGYAMYANPQQQQQQHSYPPAAMPSPQPTSVSHHAMTHQARQAEINELANHPHILHHLSPYEHIVQSLAKNTLNATSHTPNQSTGAAGGAYHTTLTFQLSQAQLARMKRAARPCTTPEAEAQQLETHLRLFSAIDLRHAPWNKNFRVLVNSREVPIPEPKKLSKSKKKGLELVRGLDISEYVQASNIVEVTVFRQSYTAELFRGLVSANLIRIRDTSELMEEFRKNIKDEESKMQARALERSCIICQSKTDPLRCSRCKNEWYCGPEHQKLHWSAHRVTCKQPTPEEDALREANEKRAAQQAMLGKNGRTRLIMPAKAERQPGEEADEDDGVEEVDALVSLKCPLSLERYENPARGVHCAHLPCFDLETYLMFSQQSGIWQCPCCYRGLPAEEIEVNLQMAAILRETDNEVSQIRVHPTGEYDILRPIPDGESGDGREPGNRKRKQPSSSPTPGANASVAPPPKVAATGATPDLAASTAAAATAASGGAATSADPYPAWNGAPASAMSTAAADGTSVLAAGFGTPATSSAFTVPAAAASSTSIPIPAPAPSPVQNGPAGTADEPIELD